MSNFLYFYPNENSTPKGSDCYLNFSSLFFTNLLSLNNYTTNSLLIVAKILSQLINHS
jgi:hypothetical protein